jgi:hypothetical protein
MKQLLGAVVWNCKRVWMTINAPSVLDKSLFAILRVTFLHISSERKEKPVPLYWLKGKDNIQFLGQTHKNSMHKTVSICSNEMQFRIITSKERYSL